MEVFKQRLKSLGKSIGGMPPWIAEKLREMASKALLNPKMLKIEKFNVL